MVTDFPIRTARDHYRGPDLKRQAEQHRFNIMADEIENYLNRVIMSNPDATQHYPYRVIASTLDYSEAQVRAVFSASNSDHVGLTVHKPSGAGSTRNGS